MQRPSRWLTAIDENRASISGAPNFAYHLCAEKTTSAQLAGLDLSCWRLAFCGAEPIQEKSLARFAAAFANVGFRRQSYYPCSNGLAGPHIATRPAIARRRGRAGRSVPGLRFSTHPMPCSGLQVSRVKRSRDLPEKRCHNRFTPPGGVAWEPTHLVGTVGFPCLGMLRWLLFPEQNEPGHAFSRTLRIGRAGKTFFHRAADLRQPFGPLFGSAHHDRLKVAAIEIGDTAEPEYTGLPEVL